ncbi:cytochrome c-type biogenesis protein CcmF [Rhodobacter viridis]|uniref:Cytochrome c-type biogenesis protein CcmF n=1 Tax=Rhodobacter viridis TaxID=1054202 RepID=A0A318U1X8_9RHOB|nr:heme lyase CcmF/NrfE family subunit [Rhodobacter viridis]PYF09268.1 cytochrome c-type biogenesis protein CcmF [Rhodobacter viridis]
MIVETGHFALILALCVALVQAIIPLVGAQKGWSGWMAVATPAALAQFLLIATAFAALTYAFVVSDFSLKLVYENSHTDKPMLYKVTGVWGNHEGSMLLWVLILSMFGAAAAAFGAALPERLRARVLSVQATIGVAFLVFVLFTSNPFLRLEEVPFNGRDMNPLLQDPGLAFHPPFLYLGYVGLSMAFSFAVAALIEGRVDAAWARWVRPWTLAAWIFLTIGIALGSWWAYYELGWGGFWFWDPVENASLMPWLLAAALLHSAIVVEKREALKSWTILLAIMAFGFSLIGTFLVRSGVISSVHSFANDPKRGVFILFILAFFTGGALTLYAARASNMQAKGLFSMVSRESALVVNNVLLAVAALVVFTGTVWPLVAELVWARKLSVGAPFFEKAFTPFMIGLALLLPLGAMMPWKRARLGTLARPLLPALALTLAVLALVWVMATGRPMLALGAAGLGAWIVFGALAEIWQRAGRTPGRVLRLPRADWGKAFAHGGLGIVFAGVGLLMAGQIEDIRVAQAGESFTVGGYTITLKGVEEVPGPNFTSKTATMEVRQGDKLVATLHPEKRIYPVQAMPTTEADIDNGVWRDVYLVIGDPQEGGGWAVRTYIKPFANWVWAGCLMMAFGGGLSLSDRRYRSAAGAHRSVAPNAVAAE